MYRPGGASASNEERRALVVALQGGDGLADALRAGALVLDDRALAPLGRWITPDFMPHRFSVRQLLLPLDEDLTVQGADNGELEHLTWRDPRDIDEDWRRGEALLVPPIRFVVQGLAAAARARQSEAALCARLRAVPAQDEPELREIISGISVQPYLTPTLPPAHAPGEL